MQTSTINPRPGRFNRAALLAAALAICSCWTASAQITDSEDSAIYLAQQIAVSSGGDPAQYLSYSRGLAKTMSQLPAAKQQVVLQIAPPPGVGDSSAGGSDTGGGSGGTDPGPAPQQSDYPSWKDFMTAFMAWLKTYFGG